MVQIILSIPLIVSLIITILAIRIWIKKAKRVGLVGKDMHKPSKNKIPEAGGIAILLGFILGGLVYVSIKTFFFDSFSDLVEIFVLLLSVLIIGFIGFIDDIFGWKIGLTKKVRIFFLIFASIPLIVINAGTSLVALPFIGLAELGLFFPLLLIPLGIIGATTTYNFLAGFNGLEAGQGIIIISFLSYISFITGSTWLTVIGLCMVAALIGFYFFNKFPAKVFPGDVLTYSVGGLIAIMAILGNFERIAVFVFIPYIIETILKIRGKLKIETFVKVNRDKSLELPRKKVYSLTHISILLLKKFKKKIYEEDVTYTIFIFQIFIILLALIIFKGALFT